MEVSCEEVDSVVACTSSALARTYCIVPFTNTRVWFTNVCHVNGNVYNDKPVGFIIFPSALQNISAFICIPAHCFAFTAAGLISP